MSIKGYKATQSDKITCFAYKVRENGTVLCNALDEKNCEDCAFYKDKAAYERQLRRCEQRNERLGLNDKYPKYKMYYMKSK